MRARLFARFGPEDGLEIEFGEEATIGRSKDSTVPLRSREVSQRHARIFFDAASAAYWVEDLGSLNGTRLDGEPVSGRMRLGSLHVLSFGAAAELFFLEVDLETGEPAAGAAEADGGHTQIDAEPPTVPTELAQPAKREQTRVDDDVPTLPTQLQAGTGSPPGGGEPGSATQMEEAPVELPPALAGGEEPAAAAPETRRFVLEVSGKDGGSFELREGDNLVGRSGRAVVTLTNPELSRRHATLRVEGGRVWLRDERSRNHTFVAGEEISGEVELEAGDEVRFGRLQARLMLAEEAGGDGESE